MKRLLRRNFTDSVIVLVLLALLSPLFFYKLGQSSLTSFDEAWYADISRNILGGGNLFHLSWNGNVYSDHPPFGFWLTSISFLLFGVSAFSARVASAGAGMLTLVLTYLLGRELFKSKYVGVLSAVALSSANWFLFRARSGNLDSVLTMLFTLCLYLAVLSLRKKSALPWLGLALACLFLTKSVVPLTILPALAVVFIGERGFSKRDFVVPFLIAVTPFFIWVGFQGVGLGQFVRHYFEIGAPGVKADGNFYGNLRQSKDYLYFSIGRWFWPCILALVAGGLTFRKKFLVLSVSFFSFVVPFVFSSRGQIWHLVPLSPVMILSFVGFSYTLARKIPQFGRSALVLLGVVTLWLSFVQLRRNRREFIDIPAFVSDEEILSSKARNYPYRLYIDGDFLPAAVFYSEKNVKQIVWKGEMAQIFLGTEPFLLITEEWRLKEENILPQVYEIIGVDRDRMLVLKK
jgi:hypothetical protein